MQMREIKRKAAAAALDLLYPNRCDCCNVRIPYDALICANCAALLQTRRISYADWAADKPPQPWAGAAVLYAYDSAAKTGVLAMKDGRRGFCAYAAAQLAPLIEQRPDCITCVPVTRERRRIQGYAHAEMLGKMLAAALDLPLRTDLLQESAGKTRQHDLPAAEREQYAARFTSAGKRLDGQKILLVDDILTTGATLRQCTRCLLESGAETVYIAAVCAGVKSTEKHS